MPDKMEGKAMTIYTEIAAKCAQIEDNAGKSYPIQEDKEDGELAIAAALYAIPSDSKLLTSQDFIGLDAALTFDCNWQLPEIRGRRDQLIAAAAYITLEIKRLDMQAQGEQA